MGYEVKIHMGYHFGTELNVVFNNQKAVKEGKKKEKDVRLYAHFHEIASVDLSKVGYSTSFADLLGKISEDKNPLYAALDSDGATGCECECDSCGEQAITEDNYGTKLVHTPLPMVYKAIMTDEIDQGKYRRFQMVLDIFKTLKTQFKEYDDMIKKQHKMSGLTCVLYGH